MNAHRQTVTAAPVVLYTLAETQEILRIGRSKLHHIVRSGELDVVEIGDRRMVEPAAIKRYVAANRRSARKDVRGKAAASP